MDSAVVDVSRLSDCRIDGDEANAARDDDGLRTESIKVDIVTSTYIG